MGPLLRIPVDLRWRCAVRKPTGAFHPAMARPQMDVKCSLEREDFPTLEAAKPQVTAGLLDHGCERIQRHFNDCWIDGRWLLIVV